MSVRKFIPISEPDIGNEELENVVDAVKSGWISSKGHYITDFEESFSTFVGTKHGVSTTNGTTALHLALTAIGIGPGDKVIVPNFTFISPVNTILYNHATPVLVDSNKLYWNLDPQEVEALIDEETKAIIVVHLYGHPADMNPIMKIARKHDLNVIEDCAEAHGATYNGKNIGTFGDVSCFSFYGNKIITTGEGGICLTDNDELADRMRMLRDHGMRPNNRYWHDEIGFNYRMTNIQAAIGLAQVSKIDHQIEKRRKLAKAYAENLHDVEGLALHPEMSWAKGVYWLYSVLVKTNKKNVSRDRLSRILSDKGVDNRRFFYPAGMMPPYKEYVGKRSFPVSAELSNTGMNLPSSSSVTTEEIEYIARIIRETLY